MRFGFAYLLIGAHLQISKPLNWRLQLGRIDLQRRQLANRIKLRQPEPSSFINEAPQSREWRRKRVQD